MTEFSSSSFFFSIQIVSNLDPFLTGVITQYLGMLLVEKVMMKLLGSQSETGCTRRQGDHVDGRIMAKKVFWEYD